MSDVLRYRDCNQQQLLELLVSLGLRVERVELTDDIPGSFWGDEEAGLIGSTLYLRDDTPVHSAMHEACHFVCMDEQRRVTLHTNAGGTQDEENAVCYLQILLSDALTEVGRCRMCSDMDGWGYSFRLGSAQRWFEQDAVDAQQWLQRCGLLELADQLTHSNG